MIDREIIVIPKKVISNACVTKEHPSHVSWGDGNTIRSKIAIAGRSMVQHEVLDRVHLISPLHYDNAEGDDVIDDDAEGDDDGDIQIPSHHRQSSYHGISQPQTPRTPFICTYSKVNEIVSMKAPKGQCLLAAAIHGAVYLLQADSGLLKLPWELTKSSSLDVQTMKYFDLLVLFVHNWPIDNTYPCLEVHQHIPTHYRENCCGTDNPLTFKQCTTSICCVTLQLTKVVVKPKRRP